MEKVVEVPHVRHYGGDALIAGTLRADPDLDGGCFWLENEYDGRDAGLAALAPQRDGEILEALMLRARFYEDGSPAELILHNEVIAREGDDIETGGGHWEIARLDLDEDLRCQLDDTVTLANLHHLDVVVRH